MPHETIDGNARRDAAEHAKSYRVRPSKKVAVAIAGNRFAAILNVAALLTIPLNIKGAVQADNSFDQWRHGAGIGGGVLSMAGVSTMSLFTLRAYTRTKKHLARFGKVDPRFFKTVIGETSSRPLGGHCQLQGMYLAMHEAGQDGAFEKMKNEHTKNVLPNF